MLRLFITSCFLFSLWCQSAAASHQEALKEAYLSLTYSLEVEWDQKNQEFQDEKMRLFHLRVRDLQRRGLKNSELVEFALNQIYSQKLRKDLQTAFSMVVVNKMPSEEASRYVMNSLHQSISRGVSWDGAKVMQPVGWNVLVVFVGAISYISAIQNNEGYTSTGLGRQVGYCSPGTVCSPRCFYDQEGGSYCDNNCWAEFCH
jgi:hypothetical protein